MMSTLRQTVTRTTFSQHVQCKEAFGILSFFLFAICYFLFSASLAQAATLSLDPDSGSYGPGNTFVVTVRLDTASRECVNAAMIELRYPSDQMKALTVSKGESLLTLWPDEPVIDQTHGVVTFTGGIPAGYCGRVQGDPGKTNILAKVIFNIQNSTEGKVPSAPTSLHLAFGTSTQVLLNDGLGTPATLTTSGATYTRTLTSKGVTNEWLDLVHADTQPPDAFTPTVEHDPNVFGGKYFVVFGTVDKQSGIHHYEIEEDDPLRLGFVRGSDAHAQFVTATSPYLLTDQELRSRITVRAIDNAGNTEEELIPPTRGAYAPFPTVDNSSRSQFNFDTWMALIAILLVLIGITYSYYFRRKQGDKGISHETTHDDGVV